MAKNQIVTDYDDAGYPMLAAFTAPLTASGVIKNGAGRLLKATVTTVLGAGTVTVYDNTTNSGTILAVIPAASAVGTVVDINLPAANGLYAQFASTGGVTFGYS